MKIRPHRLLLCSSGLLLALAMLGCDKRTPEEKGRDYAKDKLGFVEGATDELAKRGKVIGADLGKGIGELVKGTGSAVKDVAHPAVDVNVGEALKNAGLKVGQANEDEDKAGARVVVVHLKAERDYSGPLMLSAQGENNTEVQALEAQDAELGAGTTQVLRFAFDSSVRLSKMNHFELGPGLSHTISVASSAQSTAISLNQLSERKTEQGFEVSVYAKFEKATKGALSLRAYDAAHQEVGRSAELSAELRVADTAGYLTFLFDARTPVHKVKSYELHMR